MPASAAVAGEARHEGGIRAELRLEAEAVVVISRLLNTRMLTFRPLIRVGWPRGSGGFMLHSHAARREVEHSAMLLVFDHAV